MDYLLVFLIGVGAALALTRLSMVVAPLIGAIDKPGALKVHEKATPRFGGSAIMAATMAACGLMLFLAHNGPDRAGLCIVLGGATLLSLVGAVDDCRGLAPRTRLGLGLAVSVATATAALMTVDGLGNWQIPLTIILALWLTGVANALNMLDGLDGLAAGVSAIAALGIAGVALVMGNEVCAWLSLGTAGACAGFLRYNFRPASTFMGDVGSLFLGFTLAATLLLLLRGSSGSASASGAVAVVIAIALPVGDMLLAMGRRMLAHRPVFQGDRSHFYDQLRDRFGFGVVKTVFTCYLLAAAFAALGVLVSTLPMPQSLLALVVFVGALTLAVLKGGFLQVGRVLIDSSEKGMTG